MGKLGYKSYQCPATATPAGGETGGVGIFVTRQFHACAGHDGEGQQEAAGGGHQLDRLFDPHEGQQPSFAHRLPPVGGRLQQFQYQ
eukprot:5827731-Pyramimonas_sp.AAC.1